MGSDCYNEEEAPWAVSALRFKWDFGVTDRKPFLAKEKEEFPSVGTWNWSLKCKWACNIHSHERFEIVLSARPRNFVKNNNNNKKYILLPGHIFTSSS
jgi:hypothetical protein